MAAPSLPLSGPSRFSFPQTTASWAFGAYALVAWVLLLSLPESPAAYTLDAAWRAVLHHAAAAGWQSGVDLVFTYGPLGYLQLAEQYHAETFVACIIYQLLYKAFYVGLLVRFARQLPRDAAVAFLVANTLLPLLDQDSIYLLTIGYGGLVLQGDARADRLWSLPTLVFLATAALMKETFLIYGGFTLVCAAASLCMAGRQRTGALILGGFGVCFFAAYLWPAGQNLFNLPAFLRTGAEIMGGYPVAMATLPLDLKFVAGCAFVLGLVEWRLVRAAFFRAGVDLSDGRVLARRWMIFLMPSAGLFLAWRAGFTRSDPTHNITFFSYVISLATAIPVFFPAPKSIPEGVRSPARVAYAVPLLVAWIIFQYPRWNIKERIPLTQRVSANLRWLLSPGEQHAWLEAVAREAAARYTLPRCRAAVGEATIDLFGCAQTVLLEHGYNYRPAPIFQPYLAYTPALIAMNAAFYRSERAPEFVLFKPQVIDGRFPTLENAPVLLWLLRHYRPVLVEQGALLLQRKTGLPNDPAQAESLQLLAEGELTVDKVLTAPPSDGAIWCEMDWQPTLLGRLMGLVFQGPYCELDVSVPGRSTPITCRVVPAMARSGFLFDPIMASPRDFLRALASGDQPSQPGAASIHAGSSFQWLLQPKVRCRLYKVPPFASPQEAAAARAILSAAPTNRLVESAATSP